MDKAARARAVRGTTAHLTAVALVLVTPGCLPGIGRDTGHSSSPTASTAASVTTPSDSATGGVVRSWTVTIPKGSDSLITQDQTAVYRVAVTALYRSGPFTRMGFTSTLPAGTSSR